MRTISTQHRVIACSAAIFYIVTLFPFSAFAQEVSEGKRTRALIEAAFTGEKESALIRAEEGGEVRLGRASIVIPPGALKKDTEISITRLFRVAETGERLYNATEGRGGYRFLPAGQQFEKEVVITIPYEEALSGKRAALEELKTYFYDTKKKVWTALPRRALLEEEGLIESESTHFTDMINGTLTLPETADPLDFNINSIKNLEAANPLSGVIQMNGPEADSFGDASFSFQLALPSGRGGMTPELMLTYSSGSGNGIMGKGFDIRYGSVITTDTRHGLPKYDGSDTYMKDGTVLEKVGDSGADSGKGVIRYRPEREGAFERIIRYHEKNGNTADDWWEVTDRKGRVRRYGRYADGRDGKSACVTEGIHGIFTWYLTEEADAHGNTVRYIYKKHANYVYPDEIRYTGYYRGGSYTEGKYIVAFGYDEEKNADRADIRTDGRGKFITECAQRLTSIRTYYGEKTEGGQIRGYRFDYEKGFAGVSLLNRFTVIGRGGASYAYTFGYEDLPKGENKAYTGEGMFAEAVRWGNGKLQSGKSENSGQSISASAGGGYGTNVFDVRTTAGFTGSTSSGTGYATDMLIDINGDGKADRVQWKDNRLHLFLRNEGKYGAAYEDRFDEYTAFERSEGERIPKIESEYTTSSSTGWNIYSGAGSVGLSAGTTYSEVYQKSATTTVSSFMDVDGDGRVDIVFKDNKKRGLYYLRNTGEIDGRKIVFERKDFKGIPLADVTSPLTEKNIKEYAETYYKQTPFRAWRAPYSGTIRIAGKIQGAQDFAPLSVSKEADAEASNVYADIYIGDSEVGKKGSVFRHPVTKEAANVSDTSDITQGTYVYFITDTTLDPKNTDTEWNIKISYRSIRPFLTNDTPILLVPEETLWLTAPDSPGVVSDKIKNVYDGDIAQYVRAHKMLSEAKTALYRFETAEANASGKCVIRATLKADYHKENGAILNDLSFEETRCYVDTGRYIPGVLSKEQFTALKNAVRLKYREEAPEQKKERWEAFAKRFSFDADLDVYLLYTSDTKDASSAWDILSFYNDYFFEDPKDSKNTVQNIKKAALKNYIRNGIAPKWKGEKAIYTSEKAPFSLGRERIGEDGRYRSGAVYGVDGKTRLYIDTIDGKAFFGDLDTGTVYEEGEAVKGEITYQADTARAVKTDEQAGEACSESAWLFSEKKAGGQITRGELEAIYTGRDIAIAYASLDDPYWGTGLITKEALDTKLSLFDGKGVSAEEKELFKNTVYAVFAPNHYLKKTLSPEEKAIAERILTKYEAYVFFHDNPYYTEKGGNIYELKSEYANKEIDELPAELTRVIEKYRLYCYTVLSGETVYNSTALYPVDEANGYTMLVWSDDAEQTLIRKRCMAPDWDSARNFSTEDRKAESVYWYAIEYSNKDKSTAEKGTAAFNKNADNTDETLFSADEKSKGNTAVWYEKADISVLSEKYLYGGHDQWYYGIWTGDAGADFSEGKLLAARNGVSDKESFEKKKGERKELNPEEIANGNRPEQTVKKQEGYYLPQKSDEGGERLIGTIAQKYDEEEKKVILSMPYMFGDTVHCDRAGGTAFYELEGMAAVIENGLKPVSAFFELKKDTAYVPASVRKNESHGTDRSVSSNAVILSGNAGWNTTVGDIFQSIQDINGDGIPDVVRIQNNALHVIAGERTLEGEDAAIRFVADGRQNSDVTSLSHNETNVTSGGGSISASGSVIVALARGGKTANTKPTPDAGASGKDPPSFDGSVGEGLSLSSGTSKQTAGLVDINGDGLPDYFSGNFRLNVGDGFTSAGARQIIEDGNLTFSKTNSSSVNFSVSASAGTGFWKQLTQTKAQRLSIGANVGIGGNFGVSSSKITQMLLDINGDGLPDLITKDENSANTIDVCFNTGSTFAAKQTFISGDWNEVGLSEDADIDVKIDYGAAKDKTGLSIEQPNTDGIKEALRKSIETLKKSLEYSSSVSFGMSGNIGVNVNVSLTFFWGIINITTNVGGTLDYSSSTNGTEVRLTDLDGDGLADYVLCLPDGQIWYKRNLCGKAGLLKRIDFPYGGTCGITYGEQYGTVHMPQFKYVLESVTMSDGCGAGKKANIAHGAHEITKRYAYEDGVYDRYRKEFYGYGTVRSYAGWKGSAEYESETISEYYNDAYYAKGMVKSTVVKDKSGRVYARTKNAINNRYAYYDAEASVRYEGREYGQGTKSTYGYDSYGNVMEVRQETYYNADIDSILAGVAKSAEREMLRAEIGYYHNDLPYFHAHPTSIEVRGGEGELLRKREGDYDSATGALTSLRQYYDEAHYAEHRFGYDEYGNTIAVFEPGGSVRWYHYDDVVHQYPTLITKTGSMERLRAGGDNRRDATYESSITWDIATGTKTSEKDINGNVMSYVYDGWQRLTEVRSPYDKEGGMPAVRYSYHTPVNGFWYAVTENKVVTDANNTEVIKTFIQTDGLGRAIISAKTGCTYNKKEKQKEVGWNISGAVCYDVKGRTIAEGQPYFIAGESIEVINLNGKDDKKRAELYQLIRPTEKAYDALDRVVETVLPGVNEKGNKRVQKMRYGITDEGLSYTETTDPTGNIGVQYTDARGNIVKVERYSEKDTVHPLTSATYEYDAMGQMVAAYDAARNPITVTYDMLGRKTELITKDGGAKRYTYDALHLLYEDDEVMRQSGSRIDYSYDGFNRVIKIEYPEGGDVEYEYGIPKAANNNEVGAKANAAGKVISVRDEAGETRYEYGKLGEVTKETRTLTRHIPAYENEKTAVMEYVSDYLGRMQSITYPDREVVTYGYDAGGQVCSITGERDGKPYTYVADIRYDEYGQRVYIKYGNGVETNYTYDENMRWLKHIGTENKYGTQYQNINYSFDDVGNVLGYKNDCMNGARYSTEQTYTYDALYQLIKAEGVTEDNPYAIPGSPDYRSNYEQNFSFDAIGNMTYKKSKETITPAIQKKSGDDLNYEFTYQYDTNYAHRLTRAGSDQKGWRYYTYDANGNVTSESDGVAPNEDTTTLTPVTVTTHTNEEGSSVYEADYAWAWPWSDSDTGSGKISPNNKRIYEWNSRNLLMRSVALGYDTRYAYAADGNRAAKWTSTKLSETLYFNTMWTWHIDKGLSQEQQGQYSKHIYLGETRIVTKQTSDLETSYGQSEEKRHQYYYHPDHLGSAQLVTDYEGNEYQRIEYTPYGELWVEKKTANEKDMRYLPYKFTAKEQDEETGLYYYGARYLDAKYSRWMSTDPAVGEYIPQIDANISKLPAGGVYDFINLNLYHYAGNNPIKYIDPDGNFKRKQFILAAIQTVGGIGEVAGGFFATGLAPVVSIYVVINGLCNVGEGLMGMFAAAKDKEYVGMISLIASKFAGKCGASEQTQELVGAYAALADTIVDSFVTKGISVVGDGKQTVSACSKIINSLNSIGSNISEGNVYIEAAKKTVEFDQGYNKNSNSGNQDE